MCFRLILITIAVTVVPIFVMRGTLLLNISDKLWSERVDSIERQSFFLAGQLIEQDYFNGENRVIVNSLIAQLDAIYDGRVIVVDSDYTVLKDSYSRINDKKVISPQVIACMNGQETEPYYDPVYDMVEIIVPVTGGEDQAVRGLIIIDASTLDLTETYGDIKQMSLWIAIGFSAILVALAVFIGRVFTKPFKNVARSINRISEGYFDEEVSLKGPAEIETISDAFNVMLKRLKELEDSRQEFVSNVSHELKTPLTSMKVLADSLNTQPDAPVELYREFMQDIVVEIRP